MPGGWDAKEESTRPGSAGRGGWDVGVPEATGNLTQDILSGAVRRPGVQPGDIGSDRQSFNAGDMQSSSDQPMRVGDWVCAGCGSFQFKKNQTCRKCGRSQESSVGPHVKRSAQGISDITVDGPHWKKNKIPFLPPGLVIRNGMVCVDKPPQFVKVINIPADERGGLIGKRGVVIEAIRKDTKAYIKVECEKGDEFAVITIKGKQEEVEAAEIQIQSKLAEMNMPGVKHEEKLVVVPKEYIGETIGPGGRNLTTIADRTGCKVKFVEASMFDETAAPDMQVCYIKGPPEQLPLAEYLLSERVAEVKRVHDDRQAAERGIVAGLGSAGTGAPTIPCKFHMRKAGSCKNGNDCYFSHDPAIISAAKGLEEVDQNAEDYKMTYCKFWDSGLCTRGKACPFAHGVEELRGELNGRNMSIMNQAKEIQWSKWQQQEEQNKKEAQASVPAAFRTKAFQSSHASKGFGKGGARSQPYPSTPAAFKGGNSDFGWQMPSFQSFQEQAASFCLTDYNPADWV